MTPRRRLVRTVVALTLPVLVASSCTGSDVPEPEAESPATPSATPEPARAPAPPQEGRCYDLTWDEGLSPTVDAAAVPCARPHTTQTFEVAELDTVVDGHLVAVDSEEARAQAAEACPKALPDYLGATPAQMRLTMVRAVWFGPTVEESDAGHNWYRCDAVVIAGKEKLLPIRQSLRGALDTESGQSQFGLCSTGKPGSTAFARVACSQDHTWRAISTRTVKAGKGGAWPGQGRARAGESSCKSSAQSRAEDKLKFTWGYEWPTREQWEQGTRHGTCWIPD